MRKLLVVIILAVIFVAGAFVWWNNGTAAVNKKDTSEKIFVIAKGAAVRTIGNNLKEEGLIRDPVVFFIYIKKNGLDQAIQAGSYKLSPSMSLIDIMDTLQHGTVDIWLTVPEGFRSEEIAELLKRDVPSYQDLWVERLKEEEGYLFPDTYLIPKDANIETVVSIFKNNFRSKIENIGLSEDDPSLARIIIIASLIEREALKDNEKPLIASVITNRLNNGMALDIDATLQYAKGKGANGKWWNVPTAEDRAVDSSYNTYTNPGIPPGPISNPGITAISAASNPAESDYFFYIHDTNGNVHFAETLAQHNANVDKYLR